MRRENRAYILIFIFLAINVVFGQNLDRRVRDLERLVNLGVPIVSRTPTTSSLARGKSAIYGDKLYYNYGTGIGYLTIESGSLGDYLAIADTVGGPVGTRYWVLAQGYMAANAFDDSLASQGFVKADTVSTLATKYNIIDMMLMSAFEDSIAGRNLDDSKYLYLDGSRGMTGPLLGDSLNFDSDKLVYSPTNDSLLVPLLHVAGSEWESGENEKIIIDASTFSSLYQSIVFRIPGYPQYDSKIVSRLAEADLSTSMWFTNYNKDTAAQDTALYMAGGHMIIFPDPGDITSDLNDSTLLVNGSVHITENLKVDGDIPGFVLDAELSSGLSTKQDDSDTTTFDATQYDLTVGLADKLDKTAFIDSLDANDDDYLTSGDIAGKLDKTAFDDSLDAHTELATDAELSSGLADKLDKTAFIDSLNANDDDYLTSGDIAGKLDKTAFDDSLGNYALMYRLELPDSLAARNFMVRTEFADSLAGYDLMYRSEFSDSVAANGLFSSSLFPDSLDAHDDEYVKHDGSVAMTADWNIGNYDIGLGINPTYYRFHVYNGTGDSKIAVETADTSGAVEFLGLHPKNNWSFGITTTGSFKFRDASHAINRLTIDTTGVFDITGLMNISDDLSVYGDYAVIGNPAISNNVSLDIGSGGSGYKRLGFNRNGTIDFYIEEDANEELNIVGSRADEDINFYVNDGGISKEILELDAAAPAINVKNSVLSMIDDNIVLNSNFISGDRGDEGIQVEADGDALFSNNIGIGKTASYNLHIYGSVPECFFEEDDDEDWGMFVTGGDFYLKQKTGTSKKFRVRGADNDDILTIDLAEKTAIADAFSFFSSNISGTGAYEDYTYKMIFRVKDTNNYGDYLFQSIKTNAPSDTVDWLFYEGDGQTLSFGGVSDPEFELDLNGNWTKVYNDFYVGNTKWNYGATENIDGSKIDNLSLNINDLGIDGNLALGAYRVSYDGMAAEGLVFDTGNNGIFHNNVTAVADVIAQDDVQVGDDVIVPGGNISYTGANGITFSSTNQIQLNTTASYSSYNVMASDFAITHASACVFGLYDWGAATDKKRAVMGFDDGSFYIKSIMDSGGDPGGGGYAWRWTKDGSGDVEKHYWDVQESTRLTLTETALTVEDSLVTNGDAVFHETVEMDTTLNIHGMRFYGARGDTSDIASPIEGGHLYDLGDHVEYVWNGSMWKALW